MKFNTYKHGKDTIHATETAYNAIYKSQGFILATEGEPQKTEVEKNEGAENINAGESDGANNGEDSTAGKSKKSKQ